MQDTAEKPVEGQRRHGVQSIARAAAVLRALAANPDGAGLSELAVAVGLPKSTVHRLLGALGEEAFVVQDPDGRFRLGVGLAELGAATGDGVREVLRPVLLRLRADLDETIDLAVLDGTEARFVDQIPAPHRLRAVSAVGARFPLHCTANGKALLAAMSDAEALALLPAKLPELTPSTITSREELLAELAQVRRTGVAFDREEHTEGVSAVGAAIPAGTRPPVAISVPIPTPRFQLNEARYADAVSGAAAEGRRLLSAPSPPLTDTPASRYPRRSR
jgi:DNA-binding IclR family transcriptional regulator